MSMTLSPPVARNPGIVRRGPALMLLWLVCQSVSFAADYCQRPATIDFDALPPFAGRYEVVGRLPGSTTSFTGEIDIAQGDNAFRVTRTVGGKTRVGEAWVEHCSADRFPVLRIRYPDQPKPMQGQCYFRGDGDNYLLISCYTRYTEGPAHSRGLEALFQMQ